MCQKIVTASQHHLAMKECMIVPRSQLTLSVIIHPLNQMQHQRRDCKYMSENGRNVPALASLAKSGHLPADLG